MENAAQALLIAGGILIAILTISVLVYSFNSAAEFGSSQEQAEYTERLAEWNLEWEAYNKKYLYGAEVLTVINKAEQNNIEYKDDSKYSVEIIINGKPEDVTNKQYLQGKKQSIFKCVEVKYNETTGRVNKMVFEFVE